MSDGMFVDAEDSHVRCCWVENGVRCNAVPHAGGRGRSACELHAVTLRGPVSPTDPRAPTSVVPPPSPGKVA